MLPAEHGERDLEGGGFRMWAFQQCGDGESMGTESLVSVSRADQWLTRESSGIRRKLQSVTLRRNKPPGYLTKNVDFICMNLYLVKQESLGKDSWFKNIPTDNFGGLKGKCTVLLAFKSHQGVK